MQSRRNGQQGSHYKDEEEDDEDTKGKENLDSI